MTPMAAGVALFGGTFNPIHIGHLIVARCVAERLDVERLVLVPAAHPPHKGGEELAPAEHRLEMARLAVRGEPILEVSDVELHRQGPSYTFLTVQAYQASLGAGIPLIWIVGGDTLPELYTWYRIRELVECCRIVTAVRPGYQVGELPALSRVLTDEQVRRLRADVLPTPMIDISATQIRRRVAAGRSIRFLVPESVREYIQDCRLYQDRSG